MSDININENDELEELFKKRKSLDLNMSNSSFYLSDGNLISLKLNSEEYGNEVFERVLPIRAFPITDPNEFISIRLPDSPEKGKGPEIGMIRRLSDFDIATQKLINEELNRRYFIPVITKIYKMQEKFGYLYFDTETLSGKTSFVMNNPYANIRSFEDGRVFMYDIDGNCFEITDPNKLDKSSLKKIEIYL